MVRIFERNIGSTNRIPVLATDLNFLIKLDTLTQSRNGLFQNSQLKYMITGSLKVHCCSNQVYEARNKLLSVPIVSYNAHFQTRFLNESILNMSGIVCKFTLHWQMVLYNKLLV